MKDFNKRLAILISGSGTTARAILDAWKKGLIPGITPVLMVASRATAPGLVFAKEYGIASVVVDPKTYPTPHAFGAALLNVLKKYKTDIVSQNGWLPLMPESVIQAYAGAIMNQHPGPLDPGRVDFGGKGMYGKRVTCARIAYAWMSGEDFWTEATVHHVTEEFDKGMLIATVRVDIPRLSDALSYDALMKQSDHLVKTTDEVAHALLSHEHGMVIDVLMHVGNTGALPRFERKTPLVSHKNAEIVEKAKEVAINLFPKG